MKSYSSIITTFCLVFLTLGIVRYSVYQFNPEMDLLPPGEYFLNMFTRFPNIVDELSVVVSRFQSMTVRSHTTQIGIWGVIWDVIDMIAGNTSVASPTVLDAVQMFFIIISYPIRVLIWLITFMFGYNPFVAA